MKFLRRGACRWLVVLALGLAGHASAADAIPAATNLWTYDFAHTTASSSPALSPDGTIYQATFDGHLLALTPAGRLRWQFTTGTELEIKSSPAIGDDGTIYFGARDRKCYAVTPGGRLKWAFTTGAWVDASLGDKTYGRVIRSTMIIDPNGVIRYHWPEVVPDGHADRVRQKLAQLQAESK